MKASKRYSLGSVLLENIELYYSYKKYFVALYHLLLLHWRIGRLLNGSRDLRWQWNLSVGHLLHCTIIILGIWRLLHCINKFQKQVHSAETLSLLQLNYLLLTSWYQIIEETVRNIVEFNLDRVRVILWYREEQHIIRQTDKILTAEIEKTKVKIRSFLYNHLKDRIQFKIRFIN